MQNDQKTANNGAQPKGEVVAQDEAAAAHHGIGPAGDGVSDLIAPNGAGTQRARERIKGNFMPDITACLAVIRWQHLFGSEKTPDTYEKSKRCCARS